MTWYVASCIMAVVRIDSQIDHVPVFEDFFLIAAETRLEAISKAERIGKEEENASAGTRVDGHEAKIKFLGIRKLRSIYPREPAAEATIPRDGDELTHSFYHVRDLADACRLARGETITLKYIDDDDDAD